MEEQTCYGKPSKLARVSGVVPFSKKRVHVPQMPTASDLTGVAHGTFDSGRASCSLPRTRELGQSSGEQKVRIDSSDFVSRRAFVVHHPTVDHPALRSYRVTDPAP